MKDKILITGCNGLLGQKLVSILSEKYNVLATSKGECRINNQSNFKYLSLDVTNQKKVTETILNFSPNFVINSAAMTNVDLCETQKKCVMMLMLIVTKEGKLVICIDYNDKR